MASGLGRSEPDDLVIAREDGREWAPDSLTSDWANTIRSLKLPTVTLHALRHTHVSQLIATGLDVVTVSRRIGHSNPTVTLTVYAHLFGNTDERASQCRRSRDGHAARRMRTFEGWTGGNPVAISRAEGGRETPDPSLSNVQYAFKNKEVAEGMRFELTIGL